MFDSFDNLLDRVFETGAAIGSKYLDWGIASEQTKANQASRDAEIARLQSLQLTTPVSDEILGLQLPSWVIPAALLGLGGLIVMKKAK